MFFFQFLAAGGRWAELVGSIPLEYHSNNASAPKDVIGTMLLSVLNGHWRYAHINSVRGDGVNPGLLGMTSVVSEDVVRRALKKMDESEALAWLEKQNREAISPILCLPWILDVDNTVKPLYGHQEGAQIGYNPHKPGRPSHNYHSYFVAHLRLCLGVEVLPGKAHSAKLGMVGLWRILEAMPRPQWPSLVRGDCAYGNEVILCQCEGRGVPYLFKLKHTMNVKRLVQTCLRQGHWEEAGGGWQYLESVIGLKGWSHSRRVILVREAPARAPVGAQKRRRRDHLQPSLAEGAGWDAQPCAWSGRIAVLVTSETKDGGLPGIACVKTYRERADAENIIDEIKNQWGWGGYTTQKLTPCRIMAMFIALIYNWWHLYVRFYDESHTREAIRSRPILMQGVGRRVESGGQKRIKISILHAKGDSIAAAIEAISREISRLAAAAEQWTVSQRWLLFLVRIFRRHFGGKRPEGFLKEGELLLSG
jgi:Transposase DDE domain group 1